MVGGGGIPGGKFNEVRRGIIVGVVAGEAGGAVTAVPGLVKTDGVTGAVGSPGVVEGVAGVTVIVGVPGVAALGLAKSILTDVA